MRRGTTPTHTFTLPFDIATVKKLRITYEQDGFKLVKEEYDAQGNKISVKLTQSETLSFDCEKPARAQLKVRTQDDNVHVSNIVTLMIGECIDGGEI